jgi:uncharacterized protein (TIGR00299 family) protein
MKIAYFDCFSGASGDMIIGALIDAGLKIDILKNEISKLNLHGYEIHAERKNKKGISGTKFNVAVLQDHHHRNLEDIVKIIDESKLKTEIKDLSKKIFTRLAESEAKIHNKAVDEIHFHEVGAVDAIIDIVGAATGLNILGIQEIYASRIHVGTGFLECAHGTLPVPPPATLELLEGIPVYSTGIESEMVTPTGAAILSTLVKKFYSIPNMSIEKTGYGIGSKDLSIPNVLRLIIGNTIKDTEEDIIQLIETNIDDMNPEFYEYIMEVLFKRGAKDVFLTPVIMKKNRPGIILSVICTPDSLDSLINVLLKETTTLGIRISEIKKRMILKRKIISVSTRWGDVRVKVRNTGDIQNSIAPEYDDCKRIAQTENIPIREIYEEIKKTAEKQIDN